MTDIRQFEPLWGSWYVESLIGEGSFGKVYKVKRDEFGKTYYAAVKILSIPRNEFDLRLMRSEGMDYDSLQSYIHSFVEDIVQEIDIMSELRGNSNIVSLEDHMVVGRKDEIGCDILIRMELLTSLPEYEREHPLSRDDAVKLGIHICRALELCAMKHAIHRDVKPDNIFVSQYGEFKLGDFGIARQIERTMSGLSKKGTHTYMAPEVFKGGEYGASVDMYSLGLVMYRTLNHNRTPFLPGFPHPVAPSDRDEALRMRMSGDPLPLIAGVDPALCGIVLKACAYEREKRFASPTEMREALEVVSGARAYVQAPEPVRAAETTIPASAPADEPQPQRVEPEIEVSHEAAVPRRVADGLSFGKIVVMVSAIIIALGIAGSMVLFTIQSIGHTEPAPRVEAEPVSVPVPVESGAPAEGDNFKARYEALLLDYNSLKAQTNSVLSDAAASVKAERLKVESAEKKMADAEKRAIEAEARRSEAESRVRSADIKGTEADRKTAESVKRVKAAETKAAEAAKRANEAEKRANIAEEAVARAEAEIIKLEQWISQTGPQPQQLAPSGGAVRR